MRFRDGSISECVEHFVHISVECDEDSGKDWISFRGRHELYKGVWMEKSKLTETEGKVGQIS
jgi:hypothetical protein